MNFCNLFLLNGMHLLRTIFNIKYIINILNVDKLTNFCTLINNSLLPTFFFDKLLLFRSDNHCKIYVQ